MKLIYKVIFMIFLTAATFAQSLDGIKICIDPGHGGHDPANDRHIIIPDFWESEGNYYKALHTEEILTSLGATVILTRHGNDDSDEIALSVRAGIANANNVDLFHSIHSNATGTSNRVNFSLMLYRGYTDNPVFPAAKEYAITAYRQFEQANHVQNKSWDVIYGDWSFYPNWGTSGLGVLRPLTMPGILSEGSFHDYIPEAWRLKNNEYLRHEAWAITRSMLEHFSAGTLPNGNVAGILRDSFENVPSTYQPISELGDAKKPINFVKATLQPGNHVYYGDDQNNGYYMFEDISPGQYRLYLEPEYYEHDTVDITVTANKSLFVHRNLAPVPNYDIPNIVENYPADNQIDVGMRDTIKLKFDMRMNKQTAENAFSISPNISGDFSWSEQETQLNFFPLIPYTEQTEYTVTVDSNAQTVFGTKLDSSYTFNFTTGTAESAKVINYSPTDGVDSVSNLAQVTISFDKRMNENTTQTAFSISPNVNGSFTWSEDITKIIFTPSSPFISGTEYQVTISTDARTYYGGYLESEVSFGFTTRSKLNLITAYPSDGAIDISKSVQVQLQFDQAIDETTLAGNIQFLDPMDKFVSLRVDFTLYSKGMIAFIPSSSLERGVTYRVILDEGIGDIEGVKFQENVVISFTTEAYEITTGNVVDDFEVNNEWENPLDNPNSVGIDETSTFKITTAQKVDGNSSAELKYSFNQFDGYYKVSKSIPTSVGSSGSTEFGIWIKGDLSYNILEYWFADAQSNLLSIEVDTLSFTGWKMASVILADVSNDNLTFEGVGIKRSNSADSSGVIYIDDAQYNFITPVEDARNNLPVEYSLDQNYPNPFNPSTKINFNLPKNSNVKLEIFNIIGEKITTLISNKEYQAGSYTVEWNGANQFGRQVPSGVYLYKIRADKFSSVKKMMMIK